MNSNISSANVDTQSTNEDQATSQAHAFWGRVEAALAGMDRDWAWLSRQTGLSTSGISAMRGKPRVPRVGDAIKVAKAVRLDFEFLATGAIDAQDRLRTVDRVRSDLAPDQLAVLQLFSRLSIREREGVYMLMATLAGAAPDPAVLGTPSSASVHQPATRYQGQED